MVVAGILPRYIGASCKKREIKVHYPLLVASSFSGFVVWHQGLSGAIGLAIATPGHFLEDKIGIIPTTQTLFTTWNFLCIAAILVVIPFTMSTLRPKSGETVQEYEFEVEERNDLHLTEQNTGSPVDRMEKSRLLIFSIVLLGLYYLWIYFVENRQGLTLNIFNFCFLLICLLVTGSIRAFIENILDCGRIAMPFIIQYPFYAGIASVTQDSGLADLIVSGFVKISSPETLPLIGFFSGGLLNLFIPSGGGQWAVQGPIMMAAAAELGANIPRVAMGVALGDQWTNLIHPLALLPATTIAGVKTREVMGYCFMALIFSGIIFIAALIPWP